MTESVHETEAPSSTGAPLLNVRSVRKAFGDHQVLRDVTIDVPPGRTIVVLGPSGTGKSVLLKLVVGLLRPDAGEVTFDGVRVDRAPEKRLAEVRKRIGFLFQLSALFDSMTVAENLAFPLIEHTSLTRHERDSKIAAALERVDLPGIQNRFPAELSGGQQKRAALARAILLDPALMLYDEPTTGLDPIRADGINRLIRSLQTERGMAGVVVTHDLVSAEAVADDVVMLLDGTVAARGSLDELRRHDDPRVRHFLKGEYDHEDAPMTKETAS